MAIVCKSTAEIERMRASGRIVREVLDHVRALVAPGATTMDLERAAEKKIKELGAKPAFKGYYDYPCVLCTSVNEEIVHGIPSEKRVLKEPQVPNFGARGHGAKLREGMVIAIEPMVNYGKPETRVLGDKWTAVTADGSCSAHFEHCVAVTKEGPVILTR